ncbi:DUF4279 domain-containing protein [Candidatus Kaiserbacteria bacterium]|nr:DUF4279 domain-containing protein [Candidatus Kaiserbacteria bacterium]
MSTTIQIPTSTRITERDRSYPSCDRTCAKLRIYPHSTPVSEITAILGIEPTECGDVGDTKYNSYGKPRTVKNSHWLLSSEDHVESKDLRDHIDWLTGHLVPKVKEIAIVSQIERIKLCITCVWWSATGEGGPTLWPEQLEALAKLGLEVGFDIQFHDPE